MDRRSLARTYYEAIDDWDEGALRDILATDFTQHRADQTFDSRAAFVRFMREDRPRTDTRHVIDRVYDGPNGDVAVAGRLVATDGEDAGDVLFAFLDVFAVGDGRLESLRTFSTGE
jgi:hypothetical protein